MVQRHTLWLAATALLICIQPPSPANGSDFIVGCRTRPACGKVCKLVCETAKLTAVCYGCESAEICVPGPSRPGCKHCQSCCGDDCCAAGACHCGPGGCRDCRDKGPECKFCWRDWIACGCAKPRTVKVLTKYQAEKEICWYHWEVVDAACCGCVAENAVDAAGYGDGPQSLEFYKPAPPQAQLGDVLPLSSDERNHLEPLLSGNELRQCRFTDETPLQAANNEASRWEPKETPVQQDQPAEKVSLMQKFSGLLGL